MGNVIHDRRSENNAPFRVISWIGKMLPKKYLSRFAFPAYCRWLRVVCGLILGSTPVLAQSAFIRFNQVGYLPSDTKVAIAFAKTPLEGEFVLQDAATNKT
ncbi:MAG TPA: cellulase N-terminal Ig-like domain-containing protein, partial [Pyrinomonadaceae bacterium]|nr:cellulase N-terminal Ig-like domain-containing protein [Pyrinomonadaceae bacterium]